MGMDWSKTGVRQTNFMKFLGYSLDSYKTPKYNVLNEIEGAFLLANDLKESRLSRAEDSHAPQNHEGAQVAMHVIFFLIISGRSGKQRVSEEVSFSLKRGSRICARCFCSQTIV